MAGLSRFVLRHKLVVAVFWLAVLAVGVVASARLSGRLALGRGLAGAPGVLVEHDVDRVVVRCDAPLPLQADGEDLGDVAEAVFEAERDAVDVLC